jgi:hypothetical protein
MAAVDAQQRPTVLFQQSGEALCRRAVSYRDFDHPILTRTLGCLHLNGQTAFDCLANVVEEFLHRFTLRRAAWNRGDLGPESAFIGFMDYDLDRH